MADFGATAALSLAGAVIGGVSTYAQAQSQNAANRRSEASARAASQASMDQLVAQTAEERRKRILESQQLTGKLRAAAAESGALGGSFDALLQQNALDLARTDQILTDNYKAQAERVRTGLEADLASIQGRQRSSIFDTLTGTAGGAQAGLAIGNLYDSVTTYKGTKPRDPSLGYGGRQ